MGFALRRRSVESAMARVGHRTRVYIIAFRERRPHRLFELPEEPEAVSVPILASTFAHMHRALNESGDAQGAIESTRAAGFEAGAGWAAGIASDGGVRAEAVWPALADHLRDAGWGDWSWTKPHDGVLLASTANCGDGGPEHDGPAVRAFATGLVSRVLSDLAAAPVAVLEVESRARGDERYAFAFGSGATLERLYGRLEDSADLDEALARL
jgi:hypothetical protein